MQDLIQQERFEIEVLERFNSKKLLTSLVFCGGTMLRLCYGLNRFSVDLDFWRTGEGDDKKLFLSLEDYLGRSYRLVDAANKFYTALFEIKSNSFPRSLKIEIRKEAKRIRPEQTIAYSKYAASQVFLRTVSLQDMMDSKIEAFLARKEIRDAFDIEFLLKKGAKLEASQEILSKLLKQLQALTKMDFSAKLGSLLEESERSYYLTQRFKILELAIKEKL